MFILSQRHGWCPGAINREIKMTGGNIVNAINQARLVLAFTHLHLNYFGRQGLRQSRSCDIIYIIVSESSLIYIFCPGFFPVPFLCLFLAVCSVFGTKIEVVSKNHSSDGVQKERNALTLQQTDKSDKTQSRTLTLVPTTLHYRGGEYIHYNKV